MLKRFGLVLALIFLLSVSVFLGIKSSSQKIRKAVSTDLTPGFLSGQQFFPSLEKQALPEFCSRSFKAGITHHHELASQLTGKFFQCFLAGTKPETVIILGPDHFHRAGQGIVAAENNWRTYYGPLQADYEKIEFLKKSNQIEIDDHIVAGDHSISFHISYIKYYYPEAKIIPILLRYDFSQQRADSLIESLEKIIDDQTLILGSIDFSHYLSKEKAQVNDQVSQSIIENFALAQVYQHHDDFYDSAPSLYVILSLMKKKNSQAYLLSHANSADFNQDESFTTSYFNWVFE